MVTEPADSATVGLITALGSLEALSLVTDTQTLTLQNIDVEGIRQLALPHLSRKP